MRFKLNCRLSLFPKKINCLFTTRNEVEAKLCFYTCLWFCSHGGGGVFLSACWDAHTPRSRLPPGSRHSPQSKTLPGEQTLPRSRHPSGSRHPPREQTPPWGADPSLGSRHSPGSKTLPGEQTPPRIRQSARSSTCWEIRAISGRYASYLNAYLFKFERIVLNLEIIEQKVSQNSDRYVFELENRVLVQMGLWPFRTINGQNNGPNLLVGILDRISLEFFVVNPILSDLAIYCVQSHALPTELSGYVLI